MEGKSYLAILWKRKWLITATVVATLIAVLVATLLVTPTYRTSVRLRVFTAARGSVDWIDYDIAYTERLMNTYTQLATSEPVLQELAQSLSLSILPTIRAEVVPDTELMRIVVEGSDAILITAVANGLAQILVTRSQELHASGGRTAQEILGAQLAQAEESLNEAQSEYVNALDKTPDDTARIAALGRSVDVKQDVYTVLLQQFERTRVAEELRSNALLIVEPASLPREPFQPDIMLNIMLGALAGLVAGSGLALFFERLDTRVQSTDEIEELTRLPALGGIPYVRKWPSHVFLGDSSPEQEAYRRLQANLDALVQEDGLETLLVTSAEPSEGKSTIIANLAQAFAQAGRRVVVVDANLRRPALHRTFDLANEVGLSNVLAQEWSLKEAVQNSHVPDIWVLSAGTLRSNPAQLLALPRMATILEELKQPFDLILVDSPALLAVADSAILASMVDGTLLVVGRAQTNRRAVEAAQEQLADVKARLLGVIVNWARRAQDRRYYRYYQRDQKSDNGRRPGPGGDGVSREKVPAPALVAAPAKPERGREDLSA